MENQASSLTIQTVFGAIGMELLKRARLSFSQFVALFGGDWKIPAVCLLVYGLRQLHKYRMTHHKDVVETSGLPSHPYIPPTFMVPRDLVTVEEKVYREYVNAATNEHCGLVSTDVRMLAPASRADVRTMVPEQSAPGSFLQPYNEGTSFKKSVFLFYAGSHHIGCAFRTENYAVVPRHVWDQSDTVRNVTGTRSASMTSYTKILSVSDKSDTLFVEFPECFWAAFGISKTPILPVRERSALRAVCFNPHKGSFESSLGVVKDAFHTTVNTYSFVHGCTTRPGMSGCPVVNTRTNMVIGMHTHANAEKDTNVASCVYTHMVCLKLIESGITPFYSSIFGAPEGVVAEAASQCSSSEGNGSQVWDRFDDFTADDYGQSEHHEPEVFMAMLGDRRVKAFPDGRFEEEINEFFERNQRMDENPTSWANMMDDDSSVGSSSPRPEAAQVEMDFRCAPRKQVLTGVKPSTFSTTSRSSYEKAISRELARATTSYPEETDQESTPWTLVSRKSSLKSGTSSPITSGQSPTPERSDKLSSTPSQQAGSPPEPKKLGRKRKKKSRGSTGQEESLAGLPPTSTTTLSESKRRSATTPTTYVDKVIQGSPGKLPTPPTSSSLSKKVTWSSSVQPEGLETLSLTPREVKLLQEWRRNGTPKQ